MQVEGQAWFGGGADLTPAYLCEQDAREFHAFWHQLCSKHKVSLPSSVSQCCANFPGPGWESSLCTYLILTGLCLASHKSEQILIPRYCTGMFPSHSHDCWRGNCVQAKEPPVTTEHFGFLQKQVVALRRAACMRSTRSGATSTSTCLPGGSTEAWEASSSMTCPAARPALMQRR